MSYAERRLLLYVAAGLVFIWTVTHFMPTVCRPEDNPLVLIRQPSTFVSNGKEYTYNRQMPLIFIGGVPRSGTTLMRALLDAHPDIRCGQETHVLPFMLGMRAQWLSSPREITRLEEAGVSKEVLDSAVAAFALEVILRHGEPAPRLCNKDPLTFKSASYLAELFPQSKFIFMVRDGRATVHSIISRQITIQGFHLDSYRHCLKDWNRTVSLMYNQCRMLGSSRCLTVHYEQLVLHPRDSMEKILNFINVPWNDSVLHHEDFINKQGGILLSRMEKSTDQVIKPINLDALTKWVGQMPPDVIEDMAELAPMLSLLGYDPRANPPNYGSPDSAVAENTKFIHSQEALLATVTIPT